MKSLRLPVLSRVEIARPALDHEAPPRDSRADACPLPAVPAGWYAVLRSDELRAGEVVSLHYFGRALVAFRGANGEAAVLDAFCPHYGAHLGVGGRVVDGEIECPFHGWRFGSDGVCARVPCSDRAPRARVDTLPVQEHSGLVLAYVGSLEPSFQVPQIPEASSPRYAPPLLERYRARVHVQEMRENIVDESHFQFIHGQDGPAVQEFRADGAHAEVRGRLRKHVLGVLFDSSFDVHMHGPGVMVVRVRGRYIASTTVALTTPIDATRSEMRLLHYVEKPARLPRAYPLLQWFFRAVSTPEVQQEVRIWDHKTYRARPVLLPHEKGIRRLREWYAQFYEDDASVAEPTTRVIRRT